ncbi:hypothetical protein [Porphyromonas cangingivalis]|nr:hypothetical protein [Porphyromonas cangingivalis]
MKLRYKTLIWGTLALIGSSSWAAVFGFGLQDYGWGNTSFGYSLPSH